MPAAMWSRSHGTIRITTRVLPGLAGIQHALAAGPGVEIRLGAVILALAALKGDQVDAALGEECLERADESPRHGVHQRGGWHGAAADVGEEIRGAAGSLVGGLVHIQVQAVDGLNLKCDVPSEGGGRARYR